MSVPLFLRSALVFALLILTVSSAIAAPTDSVWTDAQGWHWQIVNYYPQADPGDIQFDFDFTTYTLSLNRTSVYRVGGSSGGLSELLFSGTWAVANQPGTLLYTPDPYASFENGHIVWAADTPAGYKTKLWLGGSFTDNGAATYRDTYNNRDVTGTIVLSERFGFGTAMFHMESYLEVPYNPAAVTTPELPCPTFLMSGLGLCIAFARRKGHGRHR